MSEGENIRVVVRCRPLSCHEEKNGHMSIVDVASDRHSLTLYSANIEGVLHRSSKYMTGMDMLCLDLKHWKE